MHLEVSPCPLSSSFLVMHSPPLSFLSSPLKIYVDYIKFQSCPMIYEDFQFYPYSFDL